MYESTAKQSMGSRFKSFVLQCKRVLRVTKKPSKEEFTVIVKVTAMGIAAIGALGFIVFLIKELIGLI